MLASLASNQSKVATLALAWLAEGKGLFRTNGLHRTEASVTKSLHQRKALSRWKSGKAQKSRPNIMQKKNEAIHI